MQRRGAIVHWNDEKGFGFVRCPGETAQYFFHISQYKARARPQLGEDVTFSPIRGADGKTVANAVRPLTGSAKTFEANDRHYDRDAIRVWCASAIIILAFAAAILNQLPLLAILAYLPMGVISFGLYWLDKAAARSGARRIPENTLHLFDFLCGIVGGLLAQQVLRHKTSKPGFSFVSYAIAGWHGFVLAGAGLGLLPVEEVLRAINP